MVILGVERFPTPNPQLSLRRKRMTLCGAFRCRTGVVLFADRQESISDYAKWDTSKIYLYTLENRFRVLMTGAGESCPIDEVWDRLEDTLRKTTKFDAIKPAILRAVNEVTRKTIFPVPRDERSPIDLIWAVQPLDRSLSGSPGSRIQLFSTFKLNTVKIETQYFTGTPQLLTQYIKDQYLHGQIIELEDAEGLAALLLWEAKEYDLYVGKYSDIFTLRNDHSVTRIPPGELQYWEDHWREFKAVIRPLALLTCVSSDRIYKIDDRVKSINAAMKVLQREQRKMREKYRPARSELQRKLLAEMQRVAIKIARRRVKKSFKQLTSRTSEPEQ